MVELLCTLAGGVAGSILVSSLLVHRLEQGRVEAEQTAEESDRLRGLADQLQILTDQVAADVHAHHIKVESISEHISPQRTVNPSAQPEATQFMSALHELLEANAAMQKQLLEARTQLTEKSRLIEASSIEARTDALTGLANRRALDEFLKRCSQSGSLPDVTGVLMLDIDHFKQFNDTHGHIIGDALLTNFAALLSEWCRGKFYAARYGGEEFAVILKGKSMELLAQEAATLRSHVSCKAMNIQNMQLSVTSSGGLAPLRYGEPIQDAYKRADQGLYLAKKNGRNCGFWLRGMDWVKFDTPMGTDNLLTKGSVQPPLSAAIESAFNSIEKLVHDSQNETATAKAPIPSGHLEDPAVALKAGASSHSTNDVLELKDFKQRLGVHLTQLNRAGLPATAILLQADGTAAYSDRQIELVWAAKLGIVHSHIRGIDVLCRYTRDSLCVFMPSTALEAAILRTNRIRHGLGNLHRDPSLQSPMPKKFFVAIAAVLPNDGPTEFLARLESTLEDARDNLHGEIAIHNGIDCNLSPVGT